MKSVLEVHQTVRQTYECSTRRAIKALRLTRKRHHDGIKMSHFVTSSVVYKDINGSLKKRNHLLFPRLTV